MRRLVASMCSIVALAACSGSDSGDEAADADPVSSAADADAAIVGEIERLDRRWAEYVGHRSRMATGELGDEPSVACDETSDCPLGFDVDGWYYVLDEVDVDSSVVGEMVAELGDGSTAHVVVGAEPAVYLARVDGDRRELLVADAPSVATTRDRTLELRADRCSIVDVVPRSVETMRGPRDCDDASVRWLVGVDPDRWAVDDPFATSDPRIWRAEPIDSAAGEITGPNGALLGPFDDPVARLDAALERQCGGFAGGRCRVGYAIDEQTPDRIAATIVRQNVAEGSDVAYETTYVRAVFDRLAGGAWWSTETGPNAIHRNGVGAEGFADAEARFDRCCDVTAGTLAAP